jgi:uncharacterized delta-60 repeat protein
MFIKHVLRFCLPVVLLACIPTPYTHAQEVIEDWVACYNGTGNRTDIGWDIGIDAAGYIYVTGLSNVEVSHSDFILMKYNPGGQLVWSATQDGSLSFDDAGRSMFIDSSCNVYVTGYCNYPDQSDYFTTKYDSSGNDLWTAIYDGLGHGNDLAWDIWVDEARDVYVTGYSAGIAGDNDIATIKYDSLGNEIWVSRYNGTGNWHDLGWELEVDSEGFIYVAGESWSDASSIDIMLLKYNQLGEEEWNVRYCNCDSSYNSANNLILDGDDFIYLTGMSEQQRYNHDIITIKYDATGSQQWCATYNGTGDSSDNVNAIRLDNEGNVYVAGSSWGEDSQYDYIVIKYDSTGVEQWATRYDGSTHGHDLCAAISVDSEGKVYATGTFDGYGSIVYGDYGTLKISPNGEIEWFIIYNGLGFSGDCTHAMTLSQTGEIYVTGESFGNGTIADIVTIKYMEATGISNKSHGPVRVSGFILHSPYPNPFNASTVIRYQLPVAGEVSLSVYDVSGRVVSELLNRFQPAGRYEIPFDASNLSSGVYLYQIVSDRYGDGGKMVFLK